YFDRGALEEWMIYRILLATLIANVCVLTFCMTLLAEHIIAIGLLDYDRFIKRSPWWWGDRAARAYAFVSGLLLIPAFILVWPGLVSFLRTGTISFEAMHWSRPLLAAFLGLTFVQFLATWLLTGLVSVLNQRQTFLLRRDGDAR
ncbi:MAG: hypothetical protein KDB18_13325, partial [Salinibacterium sp.]|nr:hypothetical protein [Salinibacterium sp.]